MEKTHLISPCSLKYSWTKQETLIKFEAVVCVFVKSELVSDSFVNSLLMLVFPAFGKLSGLFPFNHYIILGCDQAETAVNHNYKGRKASEGLGNKLYNEQTDSNQNHQSY